MQCQITMRDHRLVTSKPGKQLLVVMEKLKREQCMRLMGEEQHQKVVKNLMLVQERMERANLKLREKVRGDGLSEASVGLSDRQNELQSQIKRGLQLTDALTSQKND